ncbi:MAG: hypothetical protein ACKVQT_28820, partial [Burkholderiales bacterium]
MSKRPIAATDAGALTSIGTRAQSGCREAHPENRFVAKNAGAGLAASLGTLNEEDSLYDYRHSQLGRRG